MVQALQNSSKKELLFAVLIIFISSTPLLPLLEIKANRIVEVGKNLYFSRISDAIKSANEGDVIVVHEGLYEENILIDKKVSLIAKGKVTILGVKTEKPVVTIAANKVQLEGFNITATSGLFSTAVYIAKGYGLSRIYNNTIMNAYFGIYSDETFGNEIIGNWIIKNSFGIMINHTSESKFLWNKIENNKYGIVLSGSSKNILQENYLVSNQYGIYFFDSQDVLVLNHNLSNNLYGIYLTGFSSNVTIENNTVTNSQYGIYVDTSHFNNVIRNKVESSMYGIYLQNCRYNNVSNNFVRNETIGIQLYGTIDNVILNNTIIRSAIGIEIDNSYNDTIKENTFLNILAHAITAYRITKARIVRNTIDHARNGIVFDSSSLNTLVENKISNVNIGIYIYSSDSNFIENITIIKVGEWYIRSQSERYNYVWNLMLNSGKLNISFLGRIAIKNATISNIPKGYTYLNRCIFVNVTKGSFAFINFSYSDNPNEKVTILYTIDGNNWEKPDTTKLFENIKIVMVKAEDSGVYALFSYHEEKFEEVIKLFLASFLIFFVLLTLALFLIRKRI